MQKPAISVIMPVFNSGSYVGEAIQSILDQTFSDFELIIIDDGSTDSSPAIIKSFNDSRIRVITHSNNKGNYPSRNEGATIARGKYLCVMDADDFSLNIRLERQFLFMEENTEIGLAGSGFRYYGKHQNIYREKDYERIKVTLLCNNCFIHPTIIIRHDQLKKYNLYYNEKYYYSADYDLIVRSSILFPVTNINEILLHYRLNEDQITFSHRSKQAEYADEIAIMQLRKIGINPDHDEVRIHLKLIKGIPVSFRDASKLNVWINKLMKYCKNQYSEDILSSCMDSLMGKQSFCAKSEKLDFHLNLATTKKYDVKDFEVLIPVRIDSYIRKENILSVINFIQQNISIPIRVMESDITSYMNCISELENVTYHFEKDTNPIYNKTKWVNKLLSLSSSEYAIVWDTDVIVNISQLLESIKSIKTGKYSMSLPYDGTAINVDIEMSQFFRKHYSTDILESLQSHCKLMHGYYMSGGIYLIKKSYFTSHGAENEKISGWGLEDAERLKRMEASGLPVHRSSGPLFHLYHPRGENSSFANRETEKTNRLEFTRTCELC